MTVSALPERMVISGSELLQVENERLPSNISESLFVGAIEEIDVDTVAVVLCTFWCNLFYRVTNLVPA